MQKRHAPPNQPLRIGPLPGRDNTSRHQQFYCPWPHPRQNGIKSIKVQCNAFLMVKMSWNTTTIQFPVVTWIQQPCRLTKQTSCPPTSQTHAITIFSTPKKHCTHPMRQMYIPGDIPTMWNVRPFCFYHFSLHCFLQWFLVLITSNVKADSLARVCLSGSCGT